MSQVVRWLILRIGQNLRFSSLRPALCSSLKCVLIVRAFLACWVCLVGNFVQSQKILEGQNQHPANGQNRALCALTFRIDHCNKLAKIAFQIGLNVNLMLKHDFSRCFSLEVLFAHPNKNEFPEFKFLTLPENTCFWPFSADRPVTKWSQNRSKNKIFSNEPLLLFLG